MGYNRRRRLITRWIGAGMGAGEIQYLLRHEFNVDYSAGAVNGTPTTDGKSTVTVVDTENKLSVAGGYAQFSGGKASPAYGDPGIWINQAITRAPGQLITFKIRLPASNTLNAIGVDTNKLSAPNGNAVIFGASGIISQYDNNTGGQEVALYEAGAEYIVTVALRATGADHFVIGGAFETQEHIWRSSLNSTSALYVCLSNNNSANLIDYIRVPVDTWLPTPIVSDGFSGWGTSDGLGHAEGVAGGIGSGGGAYLWNAVAGTWGSAAGVASCSELAGGLGIAIVDTGNPNVNLDLTVTRSGGVVGAILRYVDANNYVYAGHDGTNAYMVKRVAGVETTVATAAVAFGAGSLRVALSKTIARMYWNSTLVQARATIGDAALQTSGKHGLYTSDTGNTFDNAVIFARGS